MRTQHLRWAPVLCACTMVLCCVANAYADGTEVYGGGGGPFLHFQTFSSKGMDQLARVVGVPALGSYLRGAGGAGYAYFRHSRIGGLGAGASLRSSALINGKERSLEVSFGYGGFLAEYVNRRGRLTTSVGCVIGGGGYEVEVKDESGSHKADKGFFCLEPCVGLHLQLVEFAALQAWAGYLLPVSEDLTFRYGSSLYRLTAGEMGGLSLKLGVIFGGQAP
ncbi:MAG: hypothetical protein H5U38_01485 [Calditrichaeota bacterium]|nr:hypothetical protein [Calditrichota bacterium]